MPSKTKTMSITLGDQAENHAGMEKIGTPAASGFTITELQDAKQKFEKDGYKCKLMLLHKKLPNDKQSDNEAALLIIRKGVKALVKDGPDDLYDEHIDLNVDKKAKMRGRVVNKHARWNLCYGDKKQEPDYDKGKGRIVAYKDVPKLNELRNNLPKYFGKKAKSLVGELNLYYDIKKCGIGYHGDSERRIVVCVRLGATIPLCYRWYNKSEPITERMEVKVHHGDVYVMSSKAVGFDWKCRSQITLRHAAGCDKYIK